ISVKNFVVICIVTFLVYYTALLYIYYQLKEINDKFIMSFHYKSIYMLMKTISKHNYVSNCITQLNEIYKYVILTIYIIVTIIFDLIIYLLHNSYKSSLVFKFALTFTFINGISMVFIGNYLWASIHKMAHWFRHLLHPFLIKHTFPYDVDYFSL